MNIKKILKNKKAIIVSITGIILVILITRFNNQQIKKSKETTYQKTTNTFNSKNEESNRIEEIKKDMEQGNYYGVNYPDVPQAQKNILDLDRSLPIYIKEFETSVGLTTTISVHKSSLDPKQVIHVEIMGLLYNNKSTDPTENPEIVAFQESFVKALSEIEKTGIDPKSLYYKFGTKDYIHEISMYWVEQLQLLEY